MSVKESIDDYVEYWHTHDTGNELHEFLGMTWEEYGYWVDTGELNLVREGK